MMSIVRTTTMLLAGAATLGAAAVAVAQSDAPRPLDLAALAKAGKVSDRFVSYNIEMAEITGGRFWRPYASTSTDRYEYRPPIDLSGQRLRRIAAQLGPAYVRISGTWANATWFSDTEDAPAKAPAGFDTVLTRQQWRGAVSFAKAANAQIVTSVALSPGVRDAQGVWQPDNTRRWWAFNRSLGGSIAAAEFGNEANMVALTKAPADYSAADYRRDYALFAEWMRRESPGTLLLAPGTAELGEPVRSMSRRGPAGKQFENDDMLTTAMPRPDAVSYHFYGSASERCSGPNSPLGQTREKALTAAWLDSVDPALGRMKAFRDRVVPGAPLWNTESAETACGGNRWAATFLDSFRFVDTLGRSALQGVEVFIHNTLTASDYALLDEHSFDPRPNYWAAVLWKRVMGTTVLAAPAAPAPEVRVYAHCLAGGRGGVGLAAINLGQAASQLQLGKAAQVWTLAGAPLETKAVTVNGKPVRADAKGNLVGLDAKRVGAGGVSLPGQSITFVSVPGAANPACR